jgi:hypothetical protein
MFEKKERRIRRSLFICLLRIGSKRGQDTSLEVPKCQGEILAGFVLLFSVDTSALKQ